MPKINWREKIEEFDGLKHLYRHKTHNKYVEYLNDYDQNFPNIHYIDEDIELKYNNTHDYSKDYLTFNIISSGTITWKANSSSTRTKTISYSLNNGETWTNITSSIAGTSINVNAGDKILFKGTNVQYTSAQSNQTSSTDYNAFSDSTADFNISGNIMSLIYGDNFIDNNNLNYAYVFSYLFINTKIHNAKNLILPTTILTEHCYHSMFHGCTSLTTAPELPATTLATYCYTSMFNGCTSLTAAPVLPVTTLYPHCYHSMFYGCTSLTAAPILPAQILMNSCYNNMFNNCTHLKSITCLATTISAGGSRLNWVNGVAATGTFIKASGMTSWPSGTDGIPTGWTVQDAS